MTGRRPVVFVGPSLDPDEARRRLDVELLPPAKPGDIDALLAREDLPAAVGIVDGSVALSDRYSRPPQIFRREVLGYRTTLI